MDDPLNDPTCVVSEHETNDVDVDQYDTPTQRATITQMQVDDLDRWLEQIRERRLVKVKQLEAIAQVKSDQVRLEAFLKLNRAYDIAKRALTKIDEQIDKAEKLVHKCRLLAMAAKLEVGMEEQDAA